MGAGLMLGGGYPALPSGSLALSEFPENYRPALLCSLTLAH